MAHKRWRKRPSAQTVFARARLENPPSSASTGSFSSGRRSVHSEQCQGRTRGPSRLRSWRYGIGPLGRSEADSGHVPVLQPSVAPDRREHLASLLGLSNLVKLPYSGSSVEILG